MEVIALGLAALIVLVHFLAIIALFCIESHTRKTRQAIETLILTLAPKQPANPPSLPSSFPSPRPSRPYTPSPPRKRPGDATQPLDP